MSVSLSRAGPVATIAVMVDVADLIALVQAGTATPAQGKLAAVRRALDELTAAVEAARATDAELDERVGAVQSAIARLKSSRPTGSL